MLPGIDSVPSTLSISNLVVTKTHESTVNKRRKVFQIPGVSSNVHFSIHNNNIVNLTKAVLERVFFIKKASGEFTRPPQPNQNIFTSGLKKFKDQLLSYVPSTTPYTSDEFVATYSGRKNKIYQKAVDTLKLREVNVKDSYVSVFGKCEKTNLSDKKDPVMRVISPRKPVYNVVVGKFLKAFEHKLYLGIARVFGETTVMKGFNVKQVASHIEKKWNKYRSPVCVGLDVSRFDQHVSKEALIWEHSVYNAHFRDNDLAKYLSWQVNNKCFGNATDGKLKYSLVGGRCSGDMNTGMGNCLLMCALIYRYMELVGVTKYSVIDNGDDAAIILDRKNLKSLDGLNDFYLSYGFTLKIEKPVYEIEQITFCQMNPIWVPGGYIMVRNPRISLAKDSLSIKPLDNEGVFKKWVKAVGEGGLSLTGGVPIVQSFYRALYRAGNGVRSLRGDPIQDDMFYWGRGMDRSYSFVEAKTRYSFYLAFGILPDMQIELEKYYDEVDPQYSKPYYTDVYGDEVYHI